MVYTYATEFQNLSGVFHGSFRENVFVFLGLAKHTGNQTSCCDPIITDLFMKYYTMNCTFCLFHPSVMFFLIFMLHFLVVIMKEMN